MTLRKTVLVVVAALSLPTLSLADDAKLPAKDSKTATAPRAEEKKDPKAPAPAPKTDAKPAPKADSKPTK